MPLCILDDISPNYIQPESIVFLKIDTQGSEHLILKGSDETLKHCIGLQLELSLVPLYENQLLYDDMINILKEKGFELWSIASVFSNPQNGRLLQVDAIFIKSS